MSLKDHAKRLLRTPANWVTSSSTGLAYRIQKAFDSPSITARFFALEEDKQVFIHPLPASSRATGLPMPPKELWEYYGQTPEQYLEMGRYDVTSMLRQLAGHGFELRPGERVLDFGCSAG